MRAAALAVGMLLHAVALGAQTYEGSGDGATPLFVLPAGLAAFEIQASAPMVALLIDERGDVVSRAIEHSGADASLLRSVEIARAGRYLFEIRTAAPWRVALRVAGGADVEGGARPIALELAAGAIDGRDAGAEAQTARYVAGGFLGGVTLGPIGTVIAVNRANRAVALPDSLRAVLPADRPEYVQAFEEAFRARVRTDRRNAAIVGGVVGTGVLAFVLARNVIGRGRSGDEHEAPPVGPEPVVVPHTLPHPVRRVPSLLRIPVR
jgi:hypothetical protein